MSISHEPEDIGLKPKGDSSDGDSPVGGSAIRAANAYPGQRHTVTIEKLTHGGAGLAHIETLPVFVSGALPGQKAEIIITKNRGSFAEARIEKVIKRSKDEVMPHCRHCHACGGCVWQQLSYIKQIEYKEEIVRETLSHLTPADPAVRAS
ncbi:MAG: TRAM domain-containing protein, partial [Candidatus Peregrinibacteria bacterium]